MASPKVSIIILNWNGWKDTIECLDSLYRVDYPSYEVILIDNASNDDSLRRIRSYCDGKERIESSFFGNISSENPIEILEYSHVGTAIEGSPNQESDFNRIMTKRKLRLIVNDKNLGFAEGCNLGMRYALASSKPDFVLLLNNDTVVHSDFLTHLIEAAAGDDSVGFAGPKVYFYEKNGRRDVISSAGGRVHMQIGRAEHTGGGSKDVGKYDCGKDVDFADGSCLLAKSEMIREIGMFDSDFFMYWEETDWCFRARRAGYRTVYVPKAVIWHKGSSSGKEGLKRYYMTRNQFWFMKRHATKRQYCGFLAYFGVTIFLYLAEMARKDDFGELSALARGLVDGLSGSSRLQSLT